MPSSSLLTLPAALLGSYLRDAVIAIAALQVYVVSSCLGIAGDVTEGTLVGYVPEWIETYQWLILADWMLRMFLRRILRMSTLSGRS